LLGVAIAIFLDESIIKLIGGSIALLAGAALYMTIRQRVDDQVQLKARRTTLPPPSFKTRVTTDPATSTTRIVFDDYQQTFNPADDDLEPMEEDHGGFEIRPVQSSERTVAAVSHADTLPVSELSGERDSFVGLGGESFRVIKPGREETETVAADNGRVQERRDTVDEPAEINTPTEVASEEPVAETASGANDFVAPGKRSIERQSSINPSTIELPDLPAVEPRTEVRKIEVPIETLEPVMLSAPVEEVQTERTTGRRQAQIALHELWSETDEEMKAGEPRAEFVRLVGQVLNAVARSIEARSIVFCWVNLEKQHLIPEARVTTGNHEIRIGARIPIGNDMVSQISRSGIPEIITDISSAAERELIPYYASPASTHSFVGVPVFFRREVVGVLVADSGNENAFDESSVATLAEYTRLISGLIRGYTEKYDLQLTAKTLETFETFHRGITGTGASPQRVASLLCQRVAELFDSLYVAVALFDEDGRRWSIAAVESETMADAIKQIEPDMNASLIGRSTRFAEEVYLERIDQEARFHPDEPMGEGGAFIALPLVATTKCYGALAIEHSSPAAFIARDIDLLRDLVRYAAMAIEVVNVNRAIETQIVLDESTGLYNSGFLLSTLEHETLRARDFRAKLSFALMTIDLPDSLRNAPYESEEVVMGAVGEIIGSTLRPYDTLGRFDQRTLGVILVGQGDQDAYLWGEKLRKEVASRILSLGQRKVSVTISVGISDLSDLADSVELVGGARQALEKARSGNGNAVILY
jgi:diguanylate cyclase (GGDEF)-like protein